MSTKTIKQRIALVAVTTLTAGFLSVVSSPAANATNDRVRISLIASTTGTASSNAAPASATQVGWVAPTNTVGVTSSTLLVLSGGAAQTGICLSTCSLPFSIENTDNDAGIGVVVVGGTLSSITHADSGTVTTVAGDRKSVSFLADGSATGQASGLVTASSGVTSMQIQFYEGTGIDNLTTVTSGTLLGSLTVTIAAASVAGTFSAANSVIATQIPYVAGETASGLLTYDNSSRIANGSRGAIYVSLKDPYTSAITTGFVTATATNGAFVNIVDSIPAAGHDYAATTAFDSEDGLAGGDAYITVTQPVAGTAGSTTVTITHNGAVIATKTLNWSGDIASIAIDAANSYSIFKNGADGDFAGGVRGIRYVVKDAAGNAVSLASTNAPTVTGATGALVGASLTGTTTTSTLQTSTVGYGLATMQVPTSALNGAATYKLRVVNGSGANVDSAEIKATVSNGDLNSFSVSWDKASYAPGELGTLTIAGKDVFGNAIADGTPLTGLSLSVASGLTAVGTAMTSSSVFEGGVATAKYSAGNTDGAYSYSVDVDTATPQSAQVGAVKIAGAAGVTNADVLKSIVSLIASINKQIQALQKLILRR